jgi:hypothetical protein
MIQVAITAWMLINATLLGPPKDGEADYIL